MRIIIKALTIIGLIALIFSCSNQENKKQIGADNRKIIGKFERYCNNFHLKKALDLYASQEIIKIKYCAKAVDLYYYLMQAAWASYYSSLYLQQISFSDYLADNSSIYKDEVRYLQLRNKIFNDRLCKSDVAGLIRNWKMKVDHPLNTERSLIDAWANNNIQKMKDLAEQKPFLYYRLVGEANNIPENIFKLQSLTGSLDHLDQLFLGWEKGKIDLIESQAKLNPFQNFSYTEPNDSIQFYSSESLLLMAKYFSWQLEKLMSQDARGINTEASFYHSWISLLSGNYNDAVEYFKMYIDSGLLAEEDVAVYQAIYDALTTRSDADYSITDESFMFSSKLLPLVEYWYYRYNTSVKESVTKDEKLDEISAILTAHWPEFTNYYQDGDGDICHYTETLYTLGVYYLNRGEIALAEKYFSAIYNIQRSFSIKDISSCGKIFQFQPTTFLPYAAAIFINNIEMNDIVLQAIKGEIQEHPYYFIPSNALNLKLIDSSIKSGVPALE